MLEPEQRSIGDAATFSSADLLQYLRRSKLATLSTLGPDGSPQSALVGIGVTDDLRIVFDTVSTSRKHRNLARDARIALVVAGPDEQTVQYEGLAFPVPTSGSDGAQLREAYYLSWPDGRDRLTWANLSYWCISPTWARYSDFNLGPLIVHFSEADDQRLHHRL
jgi:pyridoxine/pyridoxamine 5'-phosphate oxidase